MMTKKKPTKAQKLFVLDTSVILYDHNAIKNFEENDIAIPIQVLEELDNFKNGNETRNFEAREFIRFIDEVSHDYLINDWVPLNGTQKGKFKVILNNLAATPDAETVFGTSKHDHKILNTALALQEQHANKKVILVSKDICLRLKAKSLNLQAEDYETGKIKDLNTLYTGKTVLEGTNENVINQLHRDGHIEAEAVRQELESLAPEAQPYPGQGLMNNHFFILKNGKKSVLAFHNTASGEVEKVHNKKAYSIQARNAEQTFAIHALMNPHIRLVTLQGMAGTGKTLLALATALEQRRNYRQIMITCPIIPLSNKDLGFLPGDIQSKLDPFLQPLWDNLKIIKGQFDPKDKHYKKIEELLTNEKIAIAPLAYIRGRSMSKVFFIVDEAQNLTPHEIKTIISRAGDDTKIVFTGDIYQIDTPYLDSQSNGLSYLIDKVKGHSMFAHIALEKGERSDLANLANELL